MPKYPYFRQLDLPDQLRLVTVFLERRCADSELIAAVHEAADRLELYPRGTTDDRGTGSISRL
jgi:hypothetical protein